MTAENMTAENFGLAYRGERHIWCQECENNGARYVESIDDQFDLVQCTTALRDPADCASKPFRSDAMINVKKGEDALFGYGL